MPSELKIPFGYKRVFGQLQKDDGVFDSSAGKFVKAKRVATEVIVRKTKMLYPCAMPSGEVVAIRRCTVEQPELPNVDAPANHG